MIKLQQFKIIKFESGRLKECKYRIASLSLKQAKLNGEIVSMGESELIRILRTVVNRPFSPIVLDELFEKRKRASRKSLKSSAPNSYELASAEIDEYIFIPELISVLFENKSHYKKILELGGFFVNKIKYVPLMSSSGMIRRSSILFVDSRIVVELEQKLNVQRNEDIEITPAKYNSYYALASSSSLPVTFPKMAIIPDLTIKTIRRADFSRYVGDGIDPDIKEEDVAMECSAFDGQGLISPSLARIWSRDLDLDYTLSTAVVRCAFLKGMVVAFDFPKFAKEVAHKTKIVDIYGEEIDVKNVQCIISESMFKLWSSYSNTKDYVAKCDASGFGFGISRVNPKKDKTHAKSSYQFLQVLKLGDDDIAKLCKPTLDWINYCSGGNLESTLLFSMGDADLSDGWFQRLDTHLQALLLNNDAINDFYMISRLENSIAKKKTDAKMGRLLFSGNYSMMISDPYAQAAHAFGMGVLPLLQEHSHYSSYWNKRNKEHVVAVRSPIVHSSEINALNFRDDDETDKWYKQIESGIIFPAYGVGMDAAIHGGADYDGDIICTIDHNSFMKGRVDGNPVLYDVKKPSKKKITSSSQKDIYDAQLSGFGTKIGYYTNVGSSMYALLSEFPFNTIERETLLTRLKYFRVLQGVAIDAAKGLILDPFPVHFVKYKKPTDNMSSEERERVIFNNTILSDKRPMFMRWLYSHYNRKYKKELAIFNNISHTRWGISFVELLSADDRSDEQDALVLRYKRRSFFINNNSEMNRISRYVESELDKIQKTRRDADKTFDYRIYLSKEFKTPLTRDVDKMRLLFKEWRSLRKSCRNNYTSTAKEDYGSVDEMSIHINRKAHNTITSDSSQLADIAVYMCYELFEKNSRAFCWKVFGAEIVENMLGKHPEKFVRVPQKSETGNIEYLWSRYGIYRLNIED